VTRISWRRWHGLRINCSDFHLYDTYFTLSNTKNPLQERVIKNGTLNGDPDWIATGDPYSCEGLTQGSPVRYRGLRLFHFSA
jgi:hypothetical protein